MRDTVCEVDKETEEYEECDFFEELYFVVFYAEIVEIDYVL
jgi:hypothetical protein